MRIAKVKINDWDACEFFKVPEINIKKGDKVIVKMGLDVEYIGIVIDVQENELEGLEDNFVLRKVNADDIKKIKSSELEKKGFIEYCTECIKTLGLEMKIVDMHLSFDGKKMIFAFTAEGRIDFRELVKMISHRFRKSIRMHQIGIRDEAKIVGRLGMCGRELCCKSFLQELTSVGAESAEVQQITHRGADRISGICGRLMCCLNYEKEGYKKLSENLPKLASKVKYEGKEYEVLGLHILKQTVDLKIDDDTILEVAVGNLGK